MPGRNLSSTERRLLDFWQGPPASWDKPLLRSLEIVGGTGLRGINGLLVPFRFPITALCGPNGVGKSTILALAALAHHAPTGWSSSSFHPQSGAHRGYYRFSDFFLRGEGEQDVENLTVTWRYIQEGRELSRTLTKRRRGWSSYSTRPARETVFVPISRILPAYEISAVRSSFASPTSDISSVLLDEVHRRRLSFIMGREYSNVEIQRRGRHIFHRCEAGSLYTAFNMGSGESCMIALLHALQSAPRGSLIVVEEIELGLHPQAQKRLAEVLISVSLEKRLQIICSTHSETFLDALPRHARLLLRRSNEEHSIYESPSTRFAIYEMTGTTQPEIVVYCEDTTASILIQESLPNELRIRVAVREVGSDATVIRQGVAHRRAGFNIQALCVLDGDTSQADINNWISSETGGNPEQAPDYMLLPGDGLAPERWALRQIRHESYRDEFARQLGCSSLEAQSHVEAVAVELDHHNLGFALHRRTNLDELDCLRRIVRAFALRHPQLDGLRGRVETLLA